MSKGQAPPEPDHPPGIFVLFEAEQEAELPDVEDEISMSEDVAENFRKQDRASFQAELAKAMQTDLRGDFTRSLKNTRRTGPPARISQRGRPAYWCEQFRERLGSHDLPDPELSVLWSVFKCPCKVFKCPCNGAWSQVESQAGTCC